MAEAHLDHPGDVSWFLGKGPAEVVGPCPHTECRHLGVSDIAWGPDYAHYALVVCTGEAGGGGCEGNCRGWMGDYPASHPGPRMVWPTVWVEVDPATEHHTTREERQRVRSHL